MAFGYPGGIDTYIPTLELSGNLSVSFTRNPKKFPLAKYVNYTTVKQPRGAYMRFNPLDLGRVRNANTGSQWASGTLRPTGFHNTYGFQQVMFQAERHNFSATLDKLAVDVANWPVQKANSELLAQEAMTERTYLTCAKMTDSTQYAASHVVTATTAAGGFLDGGTTSDPRIYAAFSYASRIIQQDTMGRVRQGDLSVLMNHVTALKLSKSRELREYVMQQPDAIKNIRFNDENYNSVYGLPPELYTYKVIVEDTFYNSYNRGNASEAGAPCFPDNTILVFVRRGDLDQDEGVTSFSTCHLFVYEDMTVEAYDDQRHRLVYMDIVDHYTPEIVAPVTAVLITNVFS